MPPGGIEGKESGGLPPSPPPFITFLFLFRHNIGVRGRVHPQNNGELSHRKVAKTLIKDSQICQESGHHHNGVGK